mgnify:FL=1
MLFRSGKIKWTRPITLPDDPDQVVLADSRKKIYRLRVGEQIRELQSKDLEFPLIGPSSRVGNVMLASTAGPAADSLVGFDLSNLSETFRVLLNGRIIWGPMAAGDVALVKTDDGKIRGYRASGQQDFEVAIPVGEIVGSPIRDENRIVLAGRSGWLLTLDASSGSVVGQADIGQPIFSAPMLVNSNQLLIPGAEGVVYSAEVPVK